MRRIRYRTRDEEPSSGAALATLTLGALAGFAVGVLLAQKAGGLSGIAARLRRRVAELTDEERGDEPARAAAHTAGEEEEEGEEEIEALVDEEEPEDEETLGATGAELEELVLDAFEDDAVLGERAIDISAASDGVIELTGWVDSAAEAEHAVDVARAVEGVQSVRSRLAVGDPDAPAATGERGVDVGVTDETAPPAKRRTRRPPRDDAAETDTGA